MNKTVEKLKAWYEKDDNVLRIVKFPGTDRPILSVVLSFFSGFTKGRTLDRAAGVAFNFFLALFPLVLFFFTLIPYIPIPRFYERVIFLLKSFLIPSGTMDYVTKTIDGIMNQPHEGVLSISIVLCLVFGSSGIVAIFNGFKNVYMDLSTKSGGFKEMVLTRVFAIIILLLIGALIVLSIILISLGGTALRFLVTNDILKAGSLVFFLFNCIRWIVAIFALCIGVAAMYYFGNNKDERYRKRLKTFNSNGSPRYRDFVIFSPGSILATTLFIIGTVGFNIYISNFASYNALYGSIGTLIILMMWIWIVAILILAGNDLNKAIRHETGRMSDKEVVREDLERHLSVLEAQNEQIIHKINELEKKKNNLEVALAEKKKENDKMERIIAAYKTILDEIGNEGDL